jgi:hypothetical protein
VTGAIVLEKNLGSRRDREFQRSSEGAVPKRALTVPASAGLEVGATPVALEVSQRVIAHQHDVAPVTAVAPVGTAPRHVSLAAEAEAAIPPAAGADEYPRAIEHATIVEEWAARASSRPGAWSGPRAPVVDRVRGVGRARQ